METKWEVVRGVEGDEEGSGFRSVPPPAPPPANVGVEFRLWNGTPAMLAAVVAKLNALEEAWPFLKRLALQGCNGSKDHDRDGLMECDWCGPLTKLQVAMEGIPQ